MHNLTKAFTIAFAMFVLLALCIFLLFGVDPNSKMNFSVPCKDWSIVTDGKHYRYQFPYTSTKSFDYDTKQEAIDGACSMVEYLQDENSREWTETEGIKDEKNKP